MLALALAGPIAPEVAALGLKPQAAGSWGYCTATPVQTPQGGRWYTARHCLRPDRHAMIFPGLLGSVMDLRTARWKKVETQGVWTNLPGRGTDLAWTPRAEGEGWPTAKAWPAYGETLTVSGYPRGKGPVHLTCRYRGVAVGKTRLGVQSAQVFVLRGSMSCLLDEKMTRDLHGFSGGPVLNARQELVGLFVSGYTSASGQVHPGFEPLVGDRQDVWPRNGLHRFRFDPGWDAEPAWIEVRVNNGLPSGTAKVAGATGVVWNTIDFP